MSEIPAALEKLYRRLLLVIGRGRIKTSNDAGALQRHQVQLGSFETLDGLSRLGEYGFNSMPPPDSESVMVFMAGNRTDGVIIATGHQTYRMRNLASGEVSISDNRGQSVYLTQFGIIVNGGGMPITITHAPSITHDAPIVHMTGDAQIDGGLHVKGGIVADGDIADHTSKTMADMRSTYNGHGHPVAPLPPTQKQ